MSRFLNNAHQICAVSAIIVEEYGLKILNFGPEMERANLLPPRGLMAIMKFQPTLCIIGSEQSGKRSGKVMLIIDKVGRSNWDLPEAHMFVWCGKRAEPAVKMVEMESPNSGFTAVSSDICD